MEEEYVVGVDVGTGSVRAGLFTRCGELVRMAVQSIQTWNPIAGFYHQSSDDIWNCCCLAIKEVAAGVSPDSVKGLGFDATCSLVALDKNNQPITISLDGERSQNVILWMDHRAEKEAEVVNRTEHPVLKYVGGKISLEMQVPKLMWLKRNLPQTWSNAGRFFDLPDFLTWRATGADSRSLCSVVCKWTYAVSEDGVKGWNREFFSQVDLSDLLENDSVKIGCEVLAPGSPCGSGLHSEAARQLGLRVGTPVATSIIDAHAGGLGLVGCSGAGMSTDFCTRLGLICGTSTCHMAVSKEPVWVPGVWGPYHSAMVPGLWLSEGGQSATGRLLDHVIRGHPATATIPGAATSTIHVINHLNEVLEKLAKSAGLKSVDHLTEDIHVWPDFHGNRSPLADPSMRGMISGLSLSSDENDLALLYLATVQALAYGTRHILESLEAAGHRKMDCVLICGGLSNNPLFVRTQASVVGRPVLVPRQSEAVLGGAAVLGACAAGLYTDITQAITAMASPADAVNPDLHAVAFHNKKYKVFLQMGNDQKAYRNIMASL